MSQKPWMEFDCYQALGVSFDATPEALRLAYRDASRRAHPDRGGSHEAQVKVNLAFEILSHTESRAAHDRYWGVGIEKERAIEPRFSDGVAVVNLWSGPGARERKLSDSSGSSGMARRIKARVEQDRSRITLDRENRQLTLVGLFHKRLQRARLEALVATTGVVVFSLVSLIYPLLWLATVGFAVALAQRLRGATYEGLRISAAQLDAYQRLEKHAAKLARASVAHDRACLQLHLDALSHLARLVLTPSEPDDTETQLVRRTVAALFIQGYLPRTWDAESHVLLCDGDGDRVIAHIRHRPGPAFSAPSLEKFLRTKTAHNASIGYIYHRSGLSKAATERADANGVRWLSLSDYNRWVREVWSSAQSGPTGDILQRLAELQLFLDTL